MATTIVTKYGSDAPAASNIVRGELAVDTENGRLYTENIAGAVVEIGLNPEGNVDVTGTVTASGEVFIAEKLTHTGDTDTHFKFAGADDIRIVAGNVEHAAFDGTIVFNQSGSSTMDFRVESDTSEHMLFVDSSLNRVGIANNAPASALDVTGTVTADGVLSTNFAEIRSDTATLYLENAANTRYYSTKLSGTNPDLVTSYYDGTVVTERMRIDSAGNVGIGTSSPAVKLHVADGADSNAQIRINGSTSTVYSRLYSDNNGVLAIGTDGGNQAANSYMMFEVKGSERMRIDASGNVGIGASSVESTLHLQAASAGGRGATLTIDNNATSTVGNESQITFLTDAGASVAGIANARIKAISTNAGDGRADLTFTTWNGSAEGERLRIDASGNVGIGTTPDTWSLASQGIIDLGLYGSVNSSSTLGTTLSFNAYYNSGWKAKNTTGAMLYVQDSASHLWFTSASVTADATITDFSGPKMKLDASGNLLVGTTTSATKLTVQGTGTSDVQTVLSGSTANTNVGMIVFRDGASEYCGQITSNGSTNTVSYVSASDQRLKENIADADDAGSKIDAIQVRQYDWKKSNIHQDYGVIAQELAEVTPEAVHQPENPEEMMGVDYSKLVPMMLKEIQSLRARVAQLES